MNAQDFTNLVIGIGMFGRLMVLAVVLFVPSFLIYMALS